MEYFSPPSLGDEWYDPEQVRAMGAAFDHACVSLELSDAHELGLGESRIGIARKVIAAAKLGERDATRLYATVMQWAYAA